MEEKELIERKNEERKELTQQDINLLISANVLPKDIPTEMVKFFLAFCKQTNLNPFKRQVYIVPRYSSAKKGMTYTIQTGIDGYRAIADRTGICAGIDDPVYDSEEKPTKATVTVYKMVNGMRCPFVASARMAEYRPLPPNDTMWNKMPLIMLGKCAEALALRKAFPNELSGTYTDEEMQQAEKVIDVKNIETPQETNGEQSSPTFSKELICSKCEVPIKSNIADYSVNTFGKMLCWEHQQEEREFQKAGKSPEQEKLSTEEFDEHSALDDEVI